MPTVVVEAPKRLSRVLSVLRDDFTTPLLGDRRARRRRSKKRTTTLLDEAWSDSDAEDAYGAVPEDYTSIIFNLHVWSYRLSQQEFSQYERRLQLQQAVRSVAADTTSPLLPSRHHPTAAAAAAMPAGGRVQALPEPRSILRLHVLPVNHPLMAAWSCLMLILDMTYTAVLLPLMFAFDALHPSNKAYWLSVAVGFMFLVDMLLVLHRGVVIRYLDRHIYVDNPREVARLYVTHGPFLADLPVALSGPLQLLALLPIVQQAGPFDEGRWVATFVNTFVMLRGLRLVKLLLLSRELFFGKMGFSEGLADSWLREVKGHDLTSAPYYQQYVAAFYWMLISTLTVGYGDISAATPLEQGAVVCAVIVGVLFIGYAIKGITDIMAEAAVQDENTQRLTALRQRAGELKVWAAWQDLPEDLVDSMFRYFMGPWLTKQVVTRHWGNVLQDLPAQLRGQVLATLLVQRHKELFPLGSRLLRGIPQTSRWHVLSLLQPVVLAPGQQLCWEGEPATHIWLMQEGAVVALHGVVPDADSIINPPTMLVAFDAAAWLAQQRTRLQQQQQHRHHSQQHHHPHQSHPPATPAMEDAAEEGDQLDGDKNDKITNLGPAQLPEQAAAAAGPPLYSISYQAVSSSFCWAMPLHQLGLAFAGLPRLMDNFEAELQQQLQQQV